MKIVYISDVVLPSRSAKSVHIMKMCQAFAKNGHEVILLTPDRVTEESTNDLYDFYEVDPIFEVRKLNWYKDLKGKTFFYGILTAFKAKKEKPDLIYGRFLIGAFFTTLIGLSVSYEAHHPLDNSNKIERWMFRSLIKKNKFNKLVVISNALKKYFQNHYLNEQKILVAHDGADLPKKNEGLKKIKKAESFNVGYVGQLYKGKGMEIISQLAEKCPSVIFHIVGGVEKDILKWKKETSDLKNIKFHGFVPHKETGQYIEACDVMLAPYMSIVHGSGNDKQNLSEWMSPLKIFEYMAYGKPIITTNLPVLREILIDGQSALMCEADEIESWKQNLVRLQEDSKKRNDLGSRAKLDFEQYYTWDQRAKHIINYIN